MTRLLPHTQSRTLVPAPTTLTSPPPSHTHAHAYARQPQEGDAVLDARGFLSAMEPGAQDWDGGGCHVFTRILRPRVRGREAWSPCSNCWICEKWVECRFAWHHAESPPDPLALALGVEGEGEGEGAAAPSVPGPLPSKPTDVFLVADFDKWEPQVRVSPKLASDW